MSNGFLIAFATIVLVFERRVGDDDKAGGAFFLFSFLTTGFSSSCEEQPGGSNASTFLIFFDAFALDVLITESFSSRDLFASVCRYIWFNRGRR